MFIIVKNTCLSLKSILSCYLKFIYIYTYIYIYGVYLADVGGMLHVGFKTLVRLLGTIWKGLLQVSMEIVIESLLVYQKGSS